MKIDKDDPKLTAYILGELDEIESLAVEEQIDSCEDGREYVQGLRSTVDLLTEELARESASELSDEQKGTLMQEIDKLAGTEVVEIANRRWWTYKWLALAACLVVVSALGAMVKTSLFTERSIENETIAYNDIVDKAKIVDRVEVQNSMEVQNSEAPPSPTVAVSAQQTAYDDKYGKKFREKGKRYIPKPGKKMAPPSQEQAATAKADYFRRIEPTYKALQSEHKDAKNCLGLQLGDDIQILGYYGDTAIPQDDVLHTEAHLFFQTDLSDNVVNRAWNGDNISEAIPGYQYGSTPQSEPFNREAYDRVEDNPFKKVSLEPLSTFSIDVDTAAYSNMRRFLNQGKLPPPDSVRIEELVNYFDYDYPKATGREPFSVFAEVAACPWKSEHRLARIALKGREIEPDSRPESNLVFLLDVSGSMADRNKLPLVKQSLRMLTQQLTSLDRVAIVVYAGASGLVLPSTPADDSAAILSALNNLQSGGSTNGGAGIELAYKVATENFIKDGVNRVILATDGDFNVGTTNRGELTRLIEEKAKSGVFLKLLGFGMGNYQDATLEDLSGKGNGNYAYIDNRREAEKVLVDEIGSTLVTIAKDVKIQIEFNPQKVSAYRLIGYENRMLAKEDFNDDTKDAGEIGAGHTVTALYEIVPVGVDIDLPDVDELKYQIMLDMPEAEQSSEIMTLKLRYKQPDGDTSRKIQQPVDDQGNSFEQATDEFRFAAAVASFGMLLRDSEYKAGSTFHNAAEMAMNSRGGDEKGYRSEFIKLIDKAEQIAGGDVRSDVAGKEEHIQD